MHTAGGGIDAFYRNYGKALDSHEAALFIGAGVSVGAGLKAWPDLLSGIAEDLGLSVQRETDLVTLAQFHVNQQKRVRTTLNQLLVEEYGRDVPLSPSHDLIARLPIDTVWATNYDRLLERAFRDKGKLVDVKIGEDNFTAGVRGRDVTVYKMHGDVSRPGDAVLIKEDYEVYHRRREIFTNALKGDLVTKTFLFLGFSFTDPNIDYILARIRALIDENVKTHYCVMKWPDPPAATGQSQADYDYDMRRLELRIEDLQRYGIQALMVSGFGEVPQILANLAHMANRRNVFVSGSAYDYEPLGQCRVELLARQIGEGLIRGDYNLVSGFGLGIGQLVLTGALEAFYRDRTTRIGDRILVRPFPRLEQDDPDRPGMHEWFRRDLLSSAGASVFVCGNRIDPATGRAEPVAPGVMQEFAIAKEIGLHPIPIGATGGAARVIWEEVVASLEQFYPDLDVGHAFATLGDGQRSNEELVKAVLEVLGQVHRS